MKTRPDLPPYPGAPRWVKVFGTIALVVVLLFFVLLFARGPHGGHGPGLHTGSNAPRSNVTEGADRPTPPVQRP